MANEEYKFPDEDDSGFSKNDSPDDGFKIEIEDDTPEADRNRKPSPTPADPTDEELADYTKKAQSRIRGLHKSWHDERRAKEAAERERVAAEELARAIYEENKRLKDQLKSGSEVFIETSKSAVQIELDAAKKSLKEAFEQGDADKLVEAQEAVARATLKADRVQSMRPVEVKDDFKVPDRQPDQPKMKPQVAKWVEKNSDWFGADDEMTMLAIGLDKKLQRQYGSDYVGTEDYFRDIDTAMRKRFPEYFKTQSDEDDQPQENRSNPAEDTSSQRRARTASPVAPASRSTPPARVRLKSSQVALARRLGITEEQYAKQVAILNRGE